MADSDKINCRTPASLNGSGTNIPRWKYDAIRHAVLTVLRRSGAEGLMFKDLEDAARQELDEKVLIQIGSLAWHVTTVKLNMEVEGDIKRVKGSSPQRLISLV